MLLKVCVQGMGIFSHRNGLKVSVRVFCFLLLFFLCGSSENIKTVSGEDSFSSLDSLSLPPFFPPSSSPTPSLRGGLLLAINHEADKDGQQAPRLTCLCHPPSPRAVTRGACCHTPLSCWGSRGLGSRPT